MGKLKIAIAGVNGRMGMNLVQAVLQHKEEAELAVALVREHSNLLGMDVGDFLRIEKIGVPISANLEQDNSDFDVLIDFTRPEASMKYLDFCSKNNKKMIIGTTGFNAIQKKIIEQAAANTALVLAANYSVGVNLVFKLLEKATQIIGKQSDIEIIEAHHHHKVDAPSGTALQMGEHIVKALEGKLSNRAVFCREGIIGARKAGEIGFSTIRAADVVGEHTVWFASEGERVEISHKATSRMTFAKGAMRAAMWIKDKPAGLYDMTDVLGLDAL